MSTEIESCQQKSKDEEDPKNTKCYELFKKNVRSLEWSFEDIARSSGKIHFSFPSFFPSRRCTMVEKFSLLGNSI